MFTVLFLNQKGGVGKTTLADELSFALERRGFTVAFVSTDPQGGSVHEECVDPDFVEASDFQIVDTAGVLNGAVGDWCCAADVILIPMLSSTRDKEPTMRTYDIAKDSGTDAAIYLLINNFYVFGKLDRQLVEFLEAEDIPIIAKVPRAAALAQAAGAGKSVAEYAPHSHVVPAIEKLTDFIIEEMGKKHV
ncbi:AAA family ATPase [Enterococcus faecalis]|nr:AAA family ATPase [Enterococcus faecalis]